MKLFNITIGVALGTRKGQILTASTAGVAGVASWFFTQHEQLGPVVGIGLGEGTALLGVFAVFLVIALALLLYGLFRIVTRSPRRRTESEFAVRRDSSARQGP